MDKMDVEQPASEGADIDYGLYSRQVYVLGADAMKKMSASNILVVGLKGLGVEIAKNIILAGVKSVTLYDPAPAQIADLSSQFFLREEDVGKPRAAASLQRLAELNSYVPVRVLSGELTEEAISKFQVIVLTETPLEQQLRINDITRRLGIKFIVADIRGLFGVAFNDFGNNFVVHDQTGEEPIHGMIAAIEPDGTVACLDEQRHGLEDGDFVTFTEVKGMDSINGESVGPFKVTVTGPYTFRIGDISRFGNGGTGGQFRQVKQPKVLHFLSLRDTLAKPEFLITDFAKFDRPAALHVGFQALHAFTQANGRLPLPRNEADALQVVEIAMQINSKSAEPAELAEGVIKQLSYQARGDLSPMAALFGGLVAQEVLKAASGKFNPIFQWLYFDSLESLPKSVQLTEALCASTGTRYDGSIHVFGREFTQLVRNQRQFLVGAGAIGCEMLKNWAMMGLGTGPEGYVYVTDMDTIEKSNLNRQFLFRSWDLSKQKSTTAAAAVTLMNPQLANHIQAFNDRVGPDTENVFDEDFWLSLTGVTNALDNVDARKYVDRRCVYFCKPLLESGTLGTKGNTQVVVPHLTESYSSSQDPADKSIPMCTLKHFPHQIEHTIQWARDLFEGLFKQQAEEANMYLTQSNYVDQVLSHGGNQKEQLDNIRTALTKKPETFDDCVVWGRLKFEEYFNNAIQQLIYTFPRDSLTSSGQPFWSGYKRAPDPIVFDITNELHFDFVVAAANLHAFNYGIEGSRNVNYFKNAISNVIVPEFEPRSGVRIPVNDNDNVGANSTRDEIEIVAQSLPPREQYGSLRLSPADFEKDDDENFHIDFITAASNLRATNYGIVNADRHKTKLIAGRIIPAIATTTALVTGLVCLELYKMIDGKKDVEDYKNGFVNLALPFLTFSEPIKAQAMKYNDKTFTLWDRFDINGDISLQQLIDLFQKEHGLEITMLSSGVSMLYSSFTVQKPQKLAMPISKVLETTSKKPIPQYVKALVLEMCVNDVSGEDVEVPYARIVIR
ncbi:hypothetical protein BJ742DRAFT_748592 [Cladochytrium replicatum]|nr:hypothetical protein BJ742DRAFT_748592 [Cladochytrium replicatum]